MAPAANNKQPRREARLRRTTLGGAIQKPSKSIACHRCHSRKVKCSGGQPCTNCRQGDHANECEYPDRDRQISLSEKYLEEVLEENRRLRNTLSESGVSHPEPTADPNAPIANNGANPTTEDDDAVQNPLLESRPWFLPVASLDMPIHIGEAADAAFATRVRQTIANEASIHFPRMSYVSDEIILQTSEQDCPWPTPARARFLVRVALDTICRCYHMVLRSEVFEMLEQSIQDFTSCDRPTICKLYVLFALGEVYSTKTAAAENSFPGLAYFSCSRRMVNVPAERSGIVNLEICLLLSVYSFALNRRHSAYVLASSAVRLGITLGLHLNVPGFQLRDPKLREHRNRLWWTAYTLDRTWASKLGHPTSIQDEDVHVDAPSNKANSESHSEDFGDHEYVLHSIGLSRVSEQIITCLYSRRKQHDNFAQRVQIVLKHLTQWMDSLPEHLKIGNDRGLLSRQKELVYLHLRFNQCVILTTRGVVLTVLRNRLHPQSSRSGNANTTDSAITIAETCIRCARHSNRLLTDAWVDGSFAIFDYFSTQFLFSSATILAVSSLFGTKDSADDGDKFQVTVELLDQLAQNGNLGAKEFSLHAHAIKSTMQEEVATRNGQVTDGSGDVNSSIMPGQGSQMLHGAAGITAGMALAEPSFQEFLAQSDFDLQFLDVPPFTYSGNPFEPELWGNSWSPAG